MILGNFFLSDVPRPIDPISFPTRSSSDFDHGPNIKVQGHMADVAYDRGWIVRWQLERPISPCKRNSDVPERLISVKGRGTSLFRLHGRTPGKCASCAPCQRLVRRYQSWKK